MDFTKFFEASAENAPILVMVVLGLVTLYGKFGLSGKAQLGASLGTGIVFGSAFMVAALGLPTGFSGWFSVVIYGLMVGLVASGVYEVGKSLISKGNARQTEALLGNEPTEDRDDPVG
jgi:hypothetical protein